MYYVKYYVCMALSQYLSLLCLTFFLYILGTTSHHNHLLPSVGFCWHSSHVEHMELQNALFDLPLTQSLLSGYSGSSLNRP